MKSLKSDSTAETSSVPLGPKVPTVATATPNKRLPLVAVEAEGPTLLQHPTGAVASERPSAPKLGILLSTASDHRNRITAIHLAQEARRNGIATYLYLIDDGVSNANDPAVMALAGVGVHLFICSYGAQRRGVSSPIATPAGLVVLADLIKGCDRFIALH